ncbi:MAG: response regulator transcription factor [Pseudomonadota bacterium]|nr:response regulator transcription factor [Pseudomonadota bacterium]
MRCLVIEDEVETARYIEKGLSEAGFAVTIAANGVEGLYQATTAEWDAIVLDRMLPGTVDGLSVIRSLRDLGKQTPTIIVSALGNVDERVSGLRGGADDYLAKPFAMTELLARIEALLRRASAGSDLLVLEVADLVLDARAKRVTRGGQAILLQPREFRLLEYLMRHRDQVVTRTMLLKGVWDYHFDPQTNVIDVQISRLRNKVDKGRGAPLIHTMRGIGYRLAADT